MITRGFCVFRVFQDKTWILFYTLPIKGVSCLLKYEFCFDIHEFENLHDKSIVKSYRTVSKFVTSVAMCVGNVGGRHWVSLFTFQIFLNEFQSTVNENCLFDKRLKGNSILFHLKILSSIHFIECFSSCDEMTKIIGIPTQSNEVREGTNYGKYYSLEIHNFELTTMLYLTIHLTTERWFLFSLVQDQQIVMPIVQVFNITIILLV